MSTTSQQEQQEQQAQLSGLAADELGNIAPRSLDWSDADLIALDLETTGQTRRVRDYRHRHGQGD